MADKYLTAPERETVILMDAESDIAQISTHERTVLTKLRKNSAAKEVEDISFGSTEGAVFELPKELISFRTTRIKRTLTDEQRKAASERMRKAQASRLK